MASTATTPTAGPPYTHPASTHTHVVHHLTNALGVSPTPQWAQSFLAIQKPTTPLPSLLATAKVRFLNADIAVAFAHTVTPNTLNTASTSSVNRSAFPPPTATTAASSTTHSAQTVLLPPDIHDAMLPERRLRGPIALQVLAVEDISASRWSQLEDVEAAERGERTKGREIIRVVPTTERVLSGEDTSGSGGSSGGGSSSANTTNNNYNYNYNNSNTGSNSYGSSNSTAPNYGSPPGPAVGGMCKLLLQDARGERVWALELKSVKGIGVGMNIGAKMLVQNVIVARAVLLLEPESTQLLGGKVEALHRAWLENRKAQLRAGMNGGGAANGGDDTGGDNAGGGIAG